MHISAQEILTIYVINVLNGNNNKHKQYQYGAECGQICILYICLKQCLKVNNLVEQNLWNLNSQDKAKRCK